VRRIWERGKEKREKGHFSVCTTASFSDEPRRRYRSPQHEFFAPLDSHHYGLPFSCLHLPLTTRGFVAIINQTSVQKTDLFYFQFCCDFVTISNEHLCLHCAPNRTKPTPFESWHLQHTQLLETYFDLSPSCSPSSSQNRSRKLASVLC
jgi:hypothetical protein